MSLQPKGFLNQNDRVIVHRDAVIEKLSHELTILKRLKYTQCSEQMNDLNAAYWMSLLGGDMAATKVELAQLIVVDVPAQPKKIQTNRGELTVLALAFLLLAVIRSNISNILIS